MNEWTLDQGLSRVFVKDWDLAIRSVESLDVLEKGAERLRITGKAALRIVAEYGLTLHKCILPTENPLILRVVVDDRLVYVLFPEQGESGVFLDKYSPEVYGPWFKRLQKRTLFDFSNIDARIDGWTLYSEILTRSIQFNQFKTGENND